MSLLITLTPHKLPSSQVKNVKEITLLSRFKHRLQAPDGRKRRGRRLSSGLNVAIRAAAGEWGAVRGRQGVIAPGIRTAGASFWAWSPAPGSPWGLEFSYVWGGQPLAGSQK